MLMRKKTLKILIVTIGIVILGACAGSEVKREPLYGTEDPSAQVKGLETEVEDARERKLDVLAPIAFAKAELSLIKAKQALDRGDELSKIRDEVSNGQMQIQIAEQKANLTETALKDTIAARERARNAGAIKLGEAYEEAEEQFLKLSRAVEKNNLDYAQKNSRKVIQTFDDLELQAIKLEAIGEARKMINQAEEEDAEKIAPETFTIAENKLIEADKFITSDRYAKDRIRQKSSEAAFHARRLTNIIKQTEEIQKINPEKIALWIENILHETSEKLSMPDVRDKDFKTQQSGILSAIGDLQHDYSVSIAESDAQKEKIKDLNQEIIILEGRSREEQVAKERLAEEGLAAKRSLEEERRLNQVYIKIRREFGPTEAEVYKQGNSLVIRLKSIQFPVGTAIIMPDNYTILKRVQDAIHAFEDPEIVIEGHTDSTGSDEVNKRLSQERANSVREYFIANGAFSREMIYAVGYGSSQPLASNETAEGRAINRRIDVRITPQSRINR